MSLLTCYQGLQCHSAICLDWRQICDGNLNCENGEDEPNECLLLEINECQGDEYRCRTGLCIPQAFLIDFSYDCTDFSDESKTYREWTDQLSCYSKPDLACDSYLCSSCELPCGDEQYTSGELKISCNNGRDLYFRQALLSRFSADKNNSNDIGFECWFLMLCSTGKKNINFFGYDEKECQCVSATMEAKKCRTYFQKHCPRSFQFQALTNVLYPFTRFLYYNIPTYSSKWWEPTHICFNQDYCSFFSSNGLPLIDGYLCIKAERIEKSIWTLQSIFSACHTIPMSMLISNEQLYYCNQSIKYISKHRLEDDIVDCFFSEDEQNDRNSMIISALNSANRFKCATTGEWIPRPLLVDTSCEDHSNKLFIGDCNTPSDLGCQFYRGVYLPLIYYVFRENCNRHIQLYYAIEEQMDEMNCDEKPIRQCDGYWDATNGEDELNCPNTVSYYIRRTSLKCGENDHYCMDMDGIMGCLPKERAGDKIIDCLGATDERGNIYNFPTKSSQFFCSAYNGDDPKSIKIQQTCNKKVDCHYYDDEVICPWIYDAEYKGSDFICKNGTFIRWNYRCNDIINCIPDGEDEWFCDLENLPSLKFALYRVEEYPSIDTVLLPMANVSTYHLSIKSLVDDFESVSAKPVDDWFCNRGIIVTRRPSKIECFCPPSYYGSRCEYQSERILITIRMDITARLSRHQNQQSVIVLVARLILDDTVLHHEKLLHLHLMKHVFYLNYPRPPPKKRGNWSVRLDVFSATMYNVAFRTAWLFDVPFSFLPVNRLALHLTLKDQDTCNKPFCVHGSCRKYLNSPNHEYCQCDDNWSGTHCNVSTICLCGGGGKCVDGHSSSICVCPLGRMGKECQAYFNPCRDVKCENGGTCLPLDERQSIKIKRQITWHFVCSKSSAIQTTTAKQTTTYL
ncbi:unnamed protein product [Didymodactylos carnosus]|uniref:EGF-like domain-containing protein n=1 Tax=Didymodactylos carnosus TaxID=1234261 RepID=A0A814K8U1_9BILA|nr:unnamed protein product [Didymodactylos carnosus]CAF3817403.1 unnamed protein product [Didymodactylos carnosus]